MRELTTEELEAELAEQLPTRELMGVGSTMTAGHLPTETWHNPGSHEIWQDIGPQYFYRK
jgi:hypothetical protein